MNSLNFLSNILKWSPFLQQNKNKSENIQINSDPICKTYKLAAIFIRKCLFNP